jgi:hypothetical protein
MRACGGMWEYKCAVTNDCGSVKNTWIRGGVKGFRRR